MKKIKCNLCEQIDSEIISVLISKPKVENDYKIPPDIYRREIRRCLHCNVFFNYYNIKLITNDFYQGFYNNSIEYGNINKRFNRLINIPFKDSDNKQRVARILNYIRMHYNKKYSGISILDVGTGTGVFVHEMSKFFKNIYCVDPDPNSINLINKKNLAKEAWIGRVQDIPDGYEFDIITFNKVLEHVRDPINLLVQARKLLKDNGILYIELPYATDIIGIGLQNERGEFVIDHFNIFTIESIEYLLDNSGFEKIDYKNIIDPSGKHTIYAFATVR